MTGSMPVQDYVARLLSLVERATPALAALPADATQRPLAPGKWSPRELVGHLEHHLRQLLPSAALS